MLRWASHFGQERYAYIIKVDDDNVLNPYQLRLTLHKLPATEKVFWGKQAPTFGPKGEPFLAGPVKHIGPIYLMSSDVASAVCVGRCGVRVWMGAVCRERDVFGGGGGMRRVWKQLRSRGKGGGVGLNALK